MLVLKKMFKKINPNQLKKGDIVELTKSFTTGIGTFEKGERMVVCSVGLTCVDLEDEHDKSRWVTDVSFDEIRKV